MSTETINEYTDLELMRFVDTAQRENQPSRWGWRIVDATAPHKTVIDETAGDNDGLRGQHSTQSEAIKAAVKYLKLKHPHIVNMCRNEARQGMRYRRAAQ